MSFEEAYKIMGRDEAFRATVYAMNTLMIDKGLYTAQEFEKLFIEHAVNYQNGFRGKSRTQSETYHVAFGASS